MRPVIAKRTYEHRTCKRLHRQKFLNRVGGARIAPI